MDEDRPKEALAKRLSKLSEALDVFCSCAAALCHVGRASLQKNVGSWKRVARGRRSGAEGEVESDRVVIVDVRQ